MKQTYLTLVFSLVTFWSLSAQWNIAIRQHFMSPLSVKTTVSDGLDGFTAHNNNSTFYFSELEIGRFFKNNAHWGWTAAAGIGSRAQIPKFELPVRDWNTLGHPDVLHLQFADGTLRTWNARVGAQWFRRLNSKFALQARFGPAVSYMSSERANGLELTLPYFDITRYLGTRPPSGGTVTATLDRELLLSLWGDIGMTLQLFDRWRLLFGVSASGAITPNQSVVSAQLFNPANETPWGLAVSTERFYYLGGYLGISYQFAAP